MHAERIFSVINELISDAAETRYSNLIDILIAAVAKRLKDPGNQQFDEEVSSAATNLFEQLLKSRTHTFTPTWRKLIHELGLSVLLSENIRMHVDEAFETRLVDSNLKTSLEELKRQITKKHQSLAQLSEGFQTLGIKDDELEPDEVELNISMPRKSIDDQLDGFKKELDELNKQLRVISEICKTDPAPFKIRSISTNDFSLSLDISVDLAEVLLYVLVYLHAARIDLVGKFAALDDKFSDLPKDLLDQLKKFANDTTRRKIKEAIEQMAENCKQAVDSDKLDQQKGPVTAALSYLAKRLERGFNIDVRVGEHPEEEEEPEEATTPEISRLRAHKERLRGIGRRVANLKIIERQRNPILSLEDSSGDDEPAEGEPEADEGTEDAE